MRNDIKTFRCYDSTVPYLVPVGSVVRAVACCAENEEELRYVVVETVKLEQEAPESYIGHAGWMFPLDGNIWKWEEIDG